MPVAFVASELYAWCTAEKGYPQEETGLSIKNLLEVNGPV
jgi:hypothetical protein